MTAKEQKQNHDEMLSMIKQLSNPTERDINYLIGVMGKKGYHPKQKIKLEKMLNALSIKIPKEKEDKPQQGVVFDKDSSVGKRRAAEKVVEEAQALVKENTSRSKIKVVNVATQIIDKAVADAPSDRTTLFKICQKELHDLSVKYLELARNNKGSMASRLNMISRDLERHARNTLRI